MKKIISLILALSMVLAIITIIPVFAEDEPQNILFIGNSLTYVEDIPQNFKLLSESANKSVNVMKKTNGGYKLSQHLADLQSGNYNDFIENIDTVVLQEYGSYLADTANSVIEIQKLYNPGTKFYFRLTEWDPVKRINELKEINNLTLIPCEEVYNLLLSNGYSYSQLHQSDIDIHQNSLYAYAINLTQYSVIFNESCIGFSYSFLDQDAISLIPGNTEAEKDQAIYDMQQFVMQAVNQDQAPPVGLIGVAPTSPDGNDGMITGTTTEMEYKLSTASEYIPVMGTSITGLSAGTYNVRFAAKTGHNAGFITNIFLNGDGFSTVSAIELVKPDRTGIDNGFSAAILPSMLNSATTYEYGFATYNGGEAYEGAYGQWFWFKSDGTGTYTKGLLNGHVNLPVTYYYIAPAYKLWLVIRDKDNPADKKYFQLVPDISSRIAMENLVSANSFIPLGTMINDFLSTGTSGGASFANANELSSSPGTIISGRNPVGIPIQYMFAPKGIAAGGISNSDPKWAITMLHFDSETSKITMPDYLMYPQDPNGDGLYFKSITATAASVPEADATLGNPDLAHFQSQLFSKPITSTVSISPDKFGKPVKPDYIAANVNAFEEYLILNNLLPYTYEYILSDSQTAPTDWAEAATFQSSTGSEYISYSGEKYAYIRTKSGSILPENSSVAQIRLTTSNVGYTVSGYVEYPGAIVQVGESSAVTDENGYFSIDGLEAGSYNAVISKLGALTRTVTIIITNSNVEISVETNKINLYLGDANSDGLINISDISATKSIFGKTITDLDYIDNCDINQDDYINVSDITAIKNSFSKTTYSYPEWVI